MSTRITRVIKHNFMVCVKVFFWLSKIWHEIFYVCCHGPHLLRRPGYIDRTYKLIDLSSTLSLLIGIKTLTLIQDLRYQCIIRLDLSRLCDGNWNWIGTSTASTASTARRSALRSIPGSHGLSGWLRGINGHNSQLSSFHWLSEKQSTRVESFKIFTKSWIERHRQYILTNQTFVVIHQLTQSVTFV